MSLCDGADLALVRLWCIPGSDIDAVEGLPAFGAVVWGWSDQVIDGSWTYMA
jgi:hypothetical protein